MIGPGTPAAAGPEHGPRFGAPEVLKLQPDLGLKSQHHSAVPIRCLCQLSCLPDLLCAIECRGKPLRRGGNGTGRVVIVNSDGRAGEPSSVPTGLSKTLSAWQFRCSPSTIKIKGFAVFAGSEVQRAAGNDIVLRLSRGAIAGSKIDGRSPEISPVE